MAAGPKMFVGAAVMWVVAAAEGVRCWTECPSMTKKTEDNWEYVFFCCSTNQDDCCEPDVVLEAIVRMVETSVVMGIIIIAIFFVSCGCCGCCPLYRCMPCSKSGVGCCIPPGVGQGQGQSPVIIGTVVKGRET
mmetsp:Transcript_15576/g.34892  ORF Transcript_15576/g.34892 Transcript_15576/m.34892 type:complete len:134 (+) Transcript_15576:48-449(+)